MLNELSVDNLVDAINVIMSDKDHLNQMKNNCLEAAKIENWEKESLELKKIYGFNE